MKPCSIYKLWPLILVVLVVTGCRSSRFMQDDMYFTSIDAKREVREYEVNKAEIIRRQYLLNNPEKPVTTDTTVFNLDNYYDYSYSARIRRFQHNNTWAYYDPYYTNYYWFNPSSQAYFGNSVYSSYSWWGPNLGANYNPEHWNITRPAVNPKRWINPWTNTLATGSWHNPYAKYYYNGWNSPLVHQQVWTRHLTHANLYYNSLDNNCYWGWWKKGKIPGGVENNFSALMQRNGVSKDVVERPPINYTQIKEDYNRLLAANTAKEENTADSSQVASSYGTDNSVRTVKSDTKPATSNTSNTSKRWNNYKADVKINTDKKDKDNKWSRSGIFSEGSRDNNYQFNGTINNKNKDKDKEPNRR